MHASGGRRAGQGHRRKDIPCQDAVAWRAAGDGGMAFAVADGLGSRPLSQVGSQCVVEAAIDRLIQEESQDERGFRGAFRHARHALVQRAEELDVPVGDLATTLQLVLLTPSKVRAAMVGDGAVVAGEPGEDGVLRPRVLLAPEDGEYANEVVPMTASRWKHGFRYAELDGAAWAMTFSDGLTRLLLQRQDGQWAPFAPFYDAFLPKMAKTDGTGTDRLVQDFLDADNVDASWDDDKSMVVAWHDDAL